MPESPKQPAPPAHDPLDAVPMIAPGVQARTDDHGVVQLLQKRTIGRGAIGRLCTRLGLTPDRRINLDERASRFWALVNGRRNLHEVSDRIADVMSLSPADARALTVQFTRDLMIRELIVLRVSQPVGNLRGSVNQP